MYLLSHDISIKAVTKKTILLLDGQKRKGGVKPRNKEQGCVLKYQQFVALVKIVNQNTYLSVMLVQYVHFGNILNC